jgi:hypothetical protein
LFFKLGYDKVLKKWIFPMEKGLEILIQNLIDIGIAVQVNSNARGVALISLGFWDDIRPF